jgi:hypothetical protein
MMVLLFAGDSTGAGAENPGVDGDGAYAAGVDAGLTARPSSTEGPRLAVLGAFAAITGAALT